MITVKQEIPIYQENGEDSTEKDSCLLVESDDVDNASIVLGFGKRRITVVASDLLAAIANATNTNR